jgi:hypothetical protein
VSLDGAARGAHPGAELRLVSAGIDSRGNPLDRTPEGEPRETDLISVLYSKSIPLCKRWRSNGTIDQSGQAKNFELRAEPVRDIRELSALLTKLESISTACVIRGRYVGAERAARANEPAAPGHVLRRLDFFQDQPLHAAMFDVEDVETPADPQANTAATIAAWILANLPKEFHGVSYHWQLSNSFGHPTKPGLRVHIWFWLEAACASASLKAWATESNLPVDVSVFEPVQMHYTAAPVLDPGVVDPVRKRSGFVAGFDDVVAIDISRVTIGNHVTRSDKLRSTVASDPICLELEERDLIKSMRPDGGLNIECPRTSQHTGESNETSTVYFPPHTGGYPIGAFKCMHAHCRGVSRDDFIAALGIDPQGFANLDEEEASDEESRKSERLRCRTLSEFIALEGSHEWLVKGLITSGASLGVVYGKPGAGKTFWLLDACWCWAGALPWYGRTAKRRLRIVYVVAEGQNGFRQRIRALARHNNVEPDSVPILVISDEPNLNDDADGNIIAKQIEAVGGADIIVIDTLAAVSPGADENSGEAMGAVLKRCKSIATHCRAAVLVVHHPGKDESRGPRGWSGISGNVDLILEVSRSGEKRMVEVKKSRDGEDGERFGFSLVPIVLALDEDGDEITSCVVNHIDAPSLRTTAQPRGPKQLAIVAAVKELQAGRTAPVAVEHVLNTAVPNIKMRSHGARDFRRRDAKRALDALVKRGVLFAAGDNLVSAYEVTLATQVEVDGNRRRNS